MNEKLVSIIVPAYNAESRINNCIESLINQSYSRLEIIVVNDGSTDKTYDCLELLKKRDSRIRIYNQVNQGVSAARNCGIDNSSGQFIMFVDADDYLEYECIEKMLKKYDHNTDLVVCGFQIRTENSLSMNRSDKVIECQDDEEICGFLLIDQWKERLSIIGPCGKLFRASIIKENNLRFPLGLQIGEDTLFVLSYYEKIKRIVCLYDQLYIYWRERGSLSSYGHSVKMVVEARLRILESKIYIFQNKKMLNIFPDIYKEVFIIIKMFLMNGIYDKKGNYVVFYECLKKMQKNKIFIFSLENVVPDSIFEKILKTIFKTSFFNSGIAFFMKCINFFFGRI